MVLCDGTPRLLLPCRGVGATPDSSAEVGWLCCVSISGPAEHSWLYVPARAEPVEKLRGHVCAYIMGCVVVSKRVFISENPREGVPCASCAGGEHAGVTRGPDPGQLGVWCCESCAGVAGGRIWALKLWGFSCHQSTFLGAESIPPSCCLPPRRLGSVSTALPSSLPRTAGRCSGSHHHPPNPHHLAGHPLSNLGSRLPSLPSPPGPFSCPHFLAPRRHQTALGTGGAQPTGRSISVMDVIDGEAIPAWRTSPGGASWTVSFWIRSLWAGLAGVLPHAERGAVPAPVRCIRLGGGRGQRATRGFTGRRRRSIQGEGASLRLWRL